MRWIDDYLMRFLDDWVNVAILAAAVLALALVVLYWRYVRIMLKSLARNKLRTALTSCAVVIIVFLVSLILSALHFLDMVTEEKSKDFKALVTEKWQLPSQMPMSYAPKFAEGAASRPGDVKPVDHMTWSFFGGTLDGQARTRENLVFFFCMDPSKLLTMMDGMDELSDAEKARVQELIRLMQEDKRRVVLGADRLKALNKKVGERISLYSINYKDINLDDCEIIGLLPPGRYDQSAVMHIDRLLNALDAYKSDKVKNPSGQPHPLANKCLNLAALKVPDTETYNKLAQQISESPQFLDPSVKVETWSSGVASFLDAYRDLLWLVRWRMVPAMLITIVLVFATAISISVRERRTEMAVLKVLGFGPNVVLALILGEALLLGCLSGFASVGTAWLLVNKVLGGIKFPVAFFQAFYMADAALWWGPLIGGATALAGSIIPAWLARSVKVSEVFSKVS
jgi:putative ABC transport system permease protein